MQNTEHKTEYIGDLGKEFQEIDKAYEHEKAGIEVYTFTVDWCSVYTIFCCS